jgi:Lon protease-like protein
LSSALTLSSLPLFPLGSVLFPDGVLSLRIFEVRYLDMIGKCRKAGAPFGVVSLTEGSEVRIPGGTEAFSKVGTIATITELDTPQPGLMVIRARGDQRFRITSSDQLRHGLWVADVERLDQPVQQRSGDDAQLPLDPPYRLDDCGWVANRWCELLPLSAQLKQRLMELDNPLVRLELVSDVLARNGIAS